MKIVPCLQKNTKRTAFVVKLVQHLLQDANALFYNKAIEPAGTHQK
jgi:hypothetical protein